MIARPPWVVDHTGSLQHSKNYPIVKIVIATGNSGKLAELERLLEPLGLDVCPQSEFNIPDAEETGLSFVENALIKARHACHHTGLPAIADDSGLEVEALQGEPGIYSARYAGVHGNDAANNEKLLGALEGLSGEQRQARFQCLAVFMRHESDPVPIVAQGSWEGHILESPSGTKGFGYDPLFYVPSEGCSSAELDPTLKNRISHRGQALARLTKELTGLYPQP